MEPAEYAQQVRQAIERELERLEIGRVIADPVPDPAGSPGLWRALCAIGGSLVLAEFRVRTH